MARRFRRNFAFALAVVATGALSGCYAGYGGASGYGGYTRAGGYSGPTYHRSAGFSGGAEEFLVYAGFYAGVTLVAGAVELIDRCTSYRH